MQVTSPYASLVLDGSLNLSSRAMPGVHGALVQPSPVRDPRWVCWSGPLAQEMGLTQSAEWLRALSGNQSVNGISPVALRYGGHQFGHWAGQLGDGRAMTIAELSYAGKNFEIQLKGAGRTPYSRHADGRAVLRSSLREYLCSEAMHFLGVPTTRALSLVTTGEPVVRDMFYDGNPQQEPGAICTRVAPSFLRFGNFQIHAAFGETDLLQQLVDYTLARYYPGLTLLSFFEELMRRTAFMICEWYRVGFVHGVMNTDNMSILGLTIDYGPYGWLDEFDLSWTPNTTDFSHRRYAFGQQAQIAFWNLSALAQALSVLEPKVKESLANYPALYQSLYQDMLLRKLGLLHVREELMREYFDLLIQLRADMTLFHQTLMQKLRHEATLKWKEIFYRELTASDEERLEKFVSTWREAVVQDHSETAALELMQKTNPVFLPRNYIVQMILDELARGETTLLKQVESAILNPYQWNDVSRRFFVKRPDWAINKAGCSTLSCSS